MSKYLFCKYSVHHLQKSLVARLINCVFSGGDISYELTYTKPIHLCLARQLPYYNKFNGPIWDIFIFIFIPSSFSHFNSFLLNLILCWSVHMLGWEQKQASHKAFSEGWIEPVFGKVDFALTWQGYLRPLGFHKKALLSDRPALSESVAGQSEQRLTFIVYRECTDSTGTHMFRE